MPVKILKMKGKKNRIYYKNNPEQVGHGCLFNELRSIRDRQRTAVKKSIVSHHQLFHMVIKRGVLHLWILKIQR